MSVDVDVGMEIDRAVIDIIMLVVVDHKQKKKIRKKRQKKIIKQTNKQTNNSALESSESSFSSELVPKNF